MIDWNQVKDAYLQRFGALEHVHDIVLPDRELGIVEALDLDDLDPGELDGRLVEMDMEVRYWILDFRTPEGEPGAHVYATFLAAHRAVGNEVFISARVPFRELFDALAEVVSISPGDLAPLRIVRRGVCSTPFDAMLVAPAEDGTFAIGEEGGTVRHAFQLVPITPAERRLGERDPAELLRLLRAAGALTMDPLRPCVVDPGRDQGRRANAAAVLREAQKRLRSRTDRVRRTRGLYAPESVIEQAERDLAEAREELARLEPGALAVLREPDAPELGDANARMAPIEAVYGEILKLVIAPYAGLVPPRVDKVFFAFLQCFPLAHPLVWPLLYEAGTGDGRWPENEHFNDANDAKRLLGWVVEAISHGFPAANRGRLRRLGRDVLERTLRTVDRRGSVPWQARAWSDIVPALCADAAALGSVEGAIVEQALRRAAEQAMHVDASPDPAWLSARTRVARLVSSVSKTFYLDYLRAVRQATRRSSARGSKPSRRRA